jgi:hypothetical protein
MPRRACDTSQDAKLLAIERQFEEELEVLNAEFKEERRLIEEKVRVRGC